MTATPSRHAGEYNVGALFTLSCLSLLTAAFVFSIRADIIPELAEAFNFNNETVNQAAGAAFLGFALAVLVGSPMCDYVGMRALLVIAGVLHLGGTLATIFAPQLGGAASGYSILWTSMFTVGLAHGLVEAVINPLAATLFPAEKTHKLNVLHAWWPGGLVIGGLIAVGLGQVGFDYRVKLAVIVLPSVLYLLLAASQKFPPTERVASNVPTSDMFREMAKPLFIVMFLCMFLTATSELAPNQLLNTLSGSIGMKGTVVLSYVSALMFVLRFFAGPIAHRISPIGLLWASSALAGLGLLWLSYATSPVIALAAAFIFALGVCYMWPTMLGVTSELFPKGGALLLGLMGSMGNLAIYYALPWMGRIADGKVDEFLAGGMTAEAAQVAAVPFAFRATAAAPGILVVIFGLVLIYLAARGGYAKLQDEAAASIRLVQADPADFSAAAVLEAGASDAESRE